MVIVSAHSSDGNRRLVTSSVTSSGQCSTKLYIATCAQHCKALTQCLSQEYNERRMAEWKNGSSRLKTDTQPAKSGTQKQGQNYWK